MEEEDDCVLGEAVARDREEVPALPKWLESPAYVAVILTLFSSLVGGVYVMEHLLLVNMQLLGVKIPPAPPSLHDIIPIILADGLEESVTEAVKTIVFPSANVAGLGVIAVIVLSSVFVDILDMAKLPR